MTSIKYNKPSVKRTHLIDTAKLLFYKYGIRRITIDEICAKSNVSKVTYYKYFSNKSDLVLLIRDQLVEEGFQKFDEISDLVIPYPDKVMLMTKWRVEFLSSMSNDFIEDIMNVVDLYQEVKKRYLRNIEKAQDTGEINPDLSPELIWLVTEKLGELTKDGSWKNVTTDYIEFQKQLRDLYFNGILLDKTNT